MPSRTRPTRRDTASILTITFALAAIGLARLQWLPHPAAATGPAPYDLEHAMSLAGGAVPPNVESFYFFVLERSATGEHVELADKLAMAAAAHDYLGITGADPDHNLAVLRGALKHDPDRRLEGLVLIYLGPAAHETVVSSAAIGRGATIRYIAYEHRRDDAI